MKDLKDGKNQKGFGLLELLIVVLVVAIIAVSAMPRITSSRRASQMSEMQKRLVSVLRETRQEAVSQKKQITFYYDDTNKNIIIGGGSFGDVGNAENKVVSLAGDGLSAQDIAYGAPSSEASVTLADNSTLTPLADNKLVMIFQSDGSAADENEDVRNQALFFYNSKSPEESAFAVSILGTGGRVKVWRYNKQERSYVE